MAMQSSRWKFFAFLLLLVMTFIISAGCVNKQETGADTAVFTSIHDIPDVTGEEMRAVEELLAEFDNYPISFYNDNEKEWQGITFDILKEVTALTGLIFEPINAPNVYFADLMTMLSNGEGAMISKLIPNDTRRGHFIWPENETLRDNFVAISLETMPNISVHRIRQLKVGLQTGTAYADLFRTWFPNHPNVIEYNGVNAAFKGLEDGEVDIIMLSILHLLMITNYHERPGFKANIIFDYTFGSTFGFNRNEEVLCSIIDKAMAA